jgi:hypothetical protein
MIIEWLDKYYYFFIVLLLLIAAVKVLGASSFLRPEDGMAGAIALLFRWFSSTDYHVCDAPWQIKNMRLMNLVSLLFYLALICFVIITLMIKLFRQ